MIDVDVYSFIQFVDSPLVLAMAAQKEPVPLNFVHQNAILCETIKKEQKHQKLHKDYRVNPFKKSKL